jgi:GNAT superfamily N-acetyltransferase
MLFPSLTLAQRLEAHDLWNAQEHVRTQAALYPQTGALTLPVGGGLAVFAGVKSPLNGLYGLGLWEEATPAHLDEAEVFFRQRGLPMEAGVCPFTHPSFARLLVERGYVIHDYMNTYACELAGAIPEPALPAGVELRIANVEEARRWFEHSGAGGDWAEPDGISFMLVRTVQKASTHCFLAWMDGQPVAAGALDMHDGVASFIAGRTLPEYRGRGLQTALLRQRLRFAKAAGCDLALTHSRPGTTSQRNILRLGFQLVYTNIELAIPKID